ncbi:hypothetical protein [Gemmobacter sp.]|uniref:hypothetical protein n=1 Tax=Gemmobacter sp. TaxID=1898957 RepID=UPI002AFDEEB6|nr:hypothetical protein [Gemmobacter sp.]
MTAHTHTPNPGAAALTDPHGEAEALRMENAHLCFKMKAAEDGMRNAIEFVARWKARAAAAEAALAASRAPDPVANAGSCQPGERYQHIKRGTTYQVIGRGKLQTDAPLTDYAEVVAYRCEETGDVWVRPQSEFTPDRFRALPAAPVAEAATCLHLTADMATRCPTCNPGLSTALPDAGTEAQPVATIGGAELDALVARLRVTPLYEGSGEGSDIGEAAADAITALRAQPDWKAMSERLVEAADRIANWTIGGMLADDPKVREKYPHLSEAILNLRAALTDLAKMKGE